MLNSDGAAHAQTDFRDACSRRCNWPGSCWRCRRAKLKRLTRSPSLSRAASECVPHQPAGESSTYTATATAAAAPPQSQPAGAQEATFQASKSSNKGSRCGADTGGCDSKNILACLSDSMAALAKQDRARQRTATQPLRHPKLPAPQIVQAAGHRSHAGHRTVAHVGSAADSRHMRVAASQRPAGLSTPLHLRHRADSPARQGSRHAGGNASAARLPGRRRELPARDDSMLQQAPRSRMPLHVSKSTQSPGGMRSLGGARGSGALRRVQLRPHRQLEHDLSTAGSCRRKLQPQFDDARALRDEADDGRFMCPECVAALAGGSL